LKKGIFKEGSHKEKDMQEGGEFSSRKITKERERDQEIRSSPHPEGGLLL